MSQSSVSFNHNACIFVIHPKTELVLPRQPKNPCDADVTTPYTTEGISPGSVPLAVNEVPASVMERDERLEAEALNLGPDTRPWVRVRVMLNVFFRPSSPLFLQSRRVALWFLHRK